MKPDFKILDGLRGIAATYVVINHARGNLHIGGSDYAKIVPIEQWSIFDKVYYSALQLTSLGVEFVILFFVLSGFSIAYSLQEKTAVLGFYLRRLIRLYPPFILALIWAAVVFLIVQQIFPAFTEGKKSVFDSFQSTVLNLVYLSNGAFIEPFWSLIYEVIFYLLVPFFILNRRFYYIISVLLYIVSLAMSWNESTGASIIAAYIFDFNIFFCIGVWLFHNYKKAELVFLIKNTFLFYTVSILLFIAMAAVKFKLGEYNKIPLIMAALFSLVLITNFLHKRITNKVLYFLGKMSYTIYITHSATLMLFKAFLLYTGLIDSPKITAWYIWIIAVFVAIFFSFIFFYLAENPSKFLLKKVRSKQKH